MNINKKILGLATVILATANISAAAAANGSADKGDAVLFKIHDIVPVKNTEGEVIGCDYNATFFNRSNFTIRSASVDLKWKDKTIEDVIDQEKKDDAINNKRDINRARSATERLVDKTINSVVDVPTIKPAKQVTVKSRVNTDRCFLLMENVNFQVKSCNADSQQGKSVSGGGVRNGNACSRMFSYVSPDDPQYYLEFKVVTVEDEKAKNEAQINKQTSKVGDMYDKTVKAIEATNSIVSGIK